MSLLIDPGGTSVPPGLRLVRRAAELFSAGLFALLFSAFMIQIISRYGFNSPVSWSLELCSIAYVWVVFWTCGILVSERKQIVFDVLYNRFPPVPRRWLAILNTAVLAGVFLAAAPGVLDYIQFMGRRKSMLLHVPMDLVYASFGIFLLATVAGSLLRLRNLAGRGWQQHL